MVRFLILIRNNWQLITLFVGQDDPISSTSDTIDVFYKSNLETSATKTSVDAEADLFANDLNISDVPTEKITEDVEDIVNDLENLLGESSDFSLTKSSKLETTELVNENFQELLNNFEEVENTGLFDFYLNYITIFLFDKLLLQRKSYYQKK